MGCEPLPVLLVPGLVPDLTWKADGLGTALDPRAM